MVRCPKCGKMNQDSSRFCNQCGVTLPQTRIRCPECGAMNPIGNVFCSRCNTRLLPTEMQLPERPKPVEEPPAGVKGISLPTLPKAKDGALEPEELPDWLLELTEQSLGKAAETADVAEPPTADQFPDWLSDLTGDVSAPEEATPEETATGATPDWLADLLEEEVVVVAEVEAEAETAEAEEEPLLEELPDWLSDLTPEEPVVASSADVFDLAPPPSAWEAVMPVESTHSLPDIAAEPRAELPDWLLASAVPVSAAEVPVAQPLPAWLLKNVEEPAPGQEASGLPGADQFPAWLLKDAELDVFAAVPRPPAPLRPEPVKVQAHARLAVESAPSSLPVFKPEELVPAPGVPESSEPDWLLGMYGEEIEPQAAASDVETAAAVTPDWLLGMYDEAEVEPQAVAPAEEVAPGADASEAGMPDWLLAVYDEEEVEPQAAVLIKEPEEEAPAAGIPDWLAGIYSEEETEPQAAILTTAPEETAPGVGVPDWLASMYNEEEAEPLASVFTAEPEEEIASETAVPDWLAGIMVDEPVPVEPQAPSEGEQAAVDLGVPAWLSGLETGAPSASFAADSAIFAAAGAEEAPGGPSVTPDWLKGMKPVDERLALKPVQPAFIPSETDPDMLGEEYEEPVLEGGEIPDWLKGLSPATPSLVEEESAFYERVSEDESLVRAEVPSWLQGLRPPGTGPLPPLPEVLLPGAEVPLPQEGGLVRAEIPDWVRQLRPVPSAEGEAGEKRFLEPAETEGPLAGLRGVLPVGLAIDIPTDFQPVPPVAIPDSIVAEAQLWQKLLEQPRSVQRPVAQHRARSGSGQLATRLIVAVILLAVTLLGLLWSDAPLSQALSHPHIEDFSNAIDALEAGDAVIVAVEYGPAEAGEMTILAQAVMQHLADRNARVMLVSTLPEGAGLIHSLLEPLALANRLPAGQAAYLPGSASGVAQFLSESPEAKMIIILAGRGERLRWWVEQNNATKVLSVAVGVNAATAPLAMPYLETPTVMGWISGLPDVAAYQEFRELTSSILTSQRDALMLTHWAALVLLLLGLFYYLALGKKGAS